MRCLSPAARSPFGQLAKRQSRGRLEAEIPGIRRSTNFPDCLPPALHRITRTRTLRARARSQMHHDARWRANRGSDLLCSADERWLYVPRDSLSLPLRFNVRYDLCPSPFRKDYCLTCRGMLSECCTALARTHERSFRGTSVSCPSYVRNLAVRSEASRLKKCTTGIARITSLNEARKSTTEGMP
jgi:hypothetical protein